MSRLPYSLALLALPAALAACSDSERTVLRPPCPVPAFLAETADLSRFRPGGEDLTDLTLAARIEGVGGTCRPAEKEADKLDTRVAIAMRVMRGPAASGRQADVPFFIAVMIGDQITNKQVFTEHVEFPPNQDQVQVKSPEYSILLPTPKGVSGASYKLMVGFQLNPTELAYNRAHSGG